MNQYEWTKSDKKIARAAFHKGLENEMKRFVHRLQYRVNNINHFREVWKIQDYLNKKQRHIDNRYDYRYSKMYEILATLIHETYIVRSDIEGLSQDHIDSIDYYLHFFRGEL